MCAYTGLERRRLLNLRSAIDEARPLPSMVMKRMARKLGPDRLNDVDTEIREYRKGTLKNQELPGELKEKAKKSRFFNMAADKLPFHIKNMGLSSFGSDERKLESELRALEKFKAALESLEDAGVRTVGQFTSTSKATLVGTYGVPPEAVEKISEKLLEYGIRTVDNPPDEMPDS